MHVVGTTTTTNWWDPLLLICLQVSVIWRSSEDILLCGEARRTPLNDRRESNGCPEYRVSVRPPVQDRRRILLYFAKGCLQGIKFLSFLKFDLERYNYGPLPLLKHVQRFPHITWSRNNASPSKVQSYNAFPGIRKLYRRIPSVKRDSNVPSDSRLNGLCKTVIAGRVSARKR